MDWSAAYFYVPWHSARGTWHAVVSYDACVRLCLHGWEKSCMEAPVFLENDCALLREAFGWVFFNWRVDILYFFTQTEVEWYVFIHMPQKVFIWVTDFLGGVLNWIQGEATPFEIWGGDAGESIFTSSARGSCTKIQEKNCQNDGSR